jgi:uncharacterized phage protein (TIGR01671 family)
MKMREILFRGKTIDGDWTYGYYVFAPKRTGMFGQTISEADFDKHYILTMKYNLVKEINPETVGQYTGLCDKNGNKIFEGGIVDILTENEEIGIVIYDDGGFLVGADGFCVDFHSNINGTDLDIVGNIHDNPELMEGVTGDA